MKLFFRKYGTGKPVIILHGLFGQSDNWNTIGKKLSENGLEVYLTDLRNHGLSPHDPEFNYDVLSDDVHELIISEKIAGATLIGHSLGGKTAMQLAADHPESLHKLIVIDIAPREYRPAHNAVIQALQAVNIEHLKNRNEADERLSNYISDFSTKQFLLKNIYRNENGTFDWRFNLTAISNNIQEVNRALRFSNITVPSLFIYGQKSEYISDSDIKEISLRIPNVIFAKVENAGHWVHADKPDKVIEHILSFLHEN